MVELHPVPELTDEQIATLLLGAKYAVFYAIARRAIAPYQREECFETVVETILRYAHRWDPKRGKWTTFVQQAVRSGVFKFCQPLHTTRRTMDRVAIRMDQMPAFHRELLLKEAQHWSDLTPPTVHEHDQALSDRRGQRRRDRDRDRATRPIEFVPCDRNLFLETVGS